MNDREACIVLNLLTGIGYSKYTALKSTMGIPSKIFEASVSDLESVKSIGKILSNRIFNWQKYVDLNKELELVKKAGVQIITILDEDYPAQLKEISDPPLCLYVRGKLNCPYETSVAIVGTRMITSYGRETTEFLTKELVYADWTVISGLAYGVDAVAHGCAVNCKGNTIAVLGGGLARLHPQDHTELARNIINTGGAVISEFPMEMPPTRQTFPMRNRVISGLSRGVLVIEAGNSSGALITTNFALEQGRQIFAVPGRINSPQSQGTNKLIKQGAKLVENIDDILSEFEFLPGLRKKIDKVDEVRDDNISTSQVVLSSDESLITNTILLEEKSVDNIAVETGLPPGQLLAVLQQMEIKKLIKQLPGKFYKKYS